MNNHVGVFESIPINGNTSFLNLTAVIPVIENMKNIFAKRQLLSIPHRTFKFSIHSIKQN
jgi:hypothetical protein